MNSAPKPSRLAGRICVPDTLAEVVRVGKRPSEALPVIEQALELYERKGNVVSAGKARALLGALEAAPSP